MNQKFTGQYRDPETNLDYFFARYLSAPQGRFLSPDPGNAGADPTDPQSWNGYAYVRNSPLNLVDPSGMSCVDGNGQIVSDGDGAATYDNGDGKGCSAVGVQPGDPNDPSTLNDGQVNAETTAQNPSDVEYWWTISTNQIPIYDPNDQPLSKDAQQIFTLAYNQTAHDLGCVGLGWAVQGGAIAASAQVIPKAFSQRGTSGTSVASKLFGGIKLGKGFPTPVGTPGTSSFVWRSSANLGRIAGRYLPYIGTAVGAAATYACLSSKP